MLKDFLFIVLVIIGSVTYRGTLNSNLIIFVCITIVNKLSQCVCYPICIRKNAMATRSHWSVHWSTIFVAVNNTKWNVQCISFLSGTLLFECNWCSHKRASFLVKFIRKSVYKSILKISHFVVKSIWNASLLSLSRRLSNIHKNQVKSMVSILCNIVSVLFK